jgi:predicted secreted protein
MGWISGLAVYFIIWWLVIFLVLPWGVRTVPMEDVARGHAPSAPRNPRIVLKAAVTTVVAAVLWLIVYAIIESGAISFVEP